MAEASFVETRCYTILAQCVLGQGRVLENDEKVVIPEGQLFDYSHEEEEEDGRTRTRRFCQSHGK